VPEDPSRSTDTPASTELHSQRETAANDGGGLLLGIRNVAKRSKFLKKVYRRAKGIWFQRKYKDLEHEMKLGNYTLELGEDIGMRLNYVSGDYFEEFSAILDRYVEPGDTVIDIGAHVGVTSVYLSKHVGPEGKVVAVEPTPDSFATVERNIERNGIKNVEARQIAISGTNGSIPFYTNSLHTGFNSISKSNADLFLGSKQTTGEVQVESMTFDSFMESLGEAPKFIKIDCQGAEYEILSQASKSAEAPRSEPIYFYLEFWPTAIENFSDIPAVKFLGLLGKLGLDLIDSEDFFDDIKGYKTASEAENQAFVDKVTRLSRGYTNLVMEWPASS